VDKLTPFIDWVKKNKFWLGSFLLVITMVGIWFSSVGKVETDKKNNATEIKSKISAVSGVMGVSAEEGAPAHPNTDTKQGMQNLIGTVLDDLIKTWKIRHAKQQSILKWPTEVINNDDFVRAFSKYDPPEKFPEKYTGGNQMENYLTLYRANIPKQMIVLADIIKTKWIFDPKYKEERIKLGNDDLFDSGVGGGFAGGFNNRFDDDSEDEPMAGVNLGRNDPNAKRSTLLPEELNRFAVVWDDSNQALWNRKLTRFKGLDDHVNSSQDPTPLQVYMLQQDLWLLEAMFRIIREVNGDVTANDLAVIKRIDHVAFGRDARQQLGQLTPIDPMLGALNPPTGGLLDDQGMMLDDTTSETGEIDDGTMTIDPDAFNILGSLSPYHGRYVDVFFEPISAQLVRSVLTAKKLPSKYLELIVAKRVPVRIAFRMDERKIPDFITAAANSPFAFEISQIRLNRHLPGEGIEFNGGGNGKSNAAFLANAALAMGSGVAGYDDDDDSGMLARPGLSDFGTETYDPFGKNMFSRTDQEKLILIPSPVETRTNYDVDVEFYGIIKIYNPVRDKFLRTAAGQQPDEQPTETPAPKIDPSKIDPNQAAERPPATDNRASDSQVLQKS